MDIGKFYFSAEGRVSRRDFWVKGVLLTAGASIVATIVFAIVDVIITGGDGGISSTLGIIWNISLLWPGLALQIKRLHDCNHSGGRIFGYYGLFILAVVFMQVIPIVGLLFMLGAGVLSIMVLVDLFSKGSEGINAYGPNPLKSDEVYE